MDLSEILLFGKGFNGNRVLLTEINGRASELKPRSDCILVPADHTLLFLQNKSMVISGVEIDFFCYLQKIASAMISNLLNYASCYKQNEKYDLLLYYCQYH